MKIFNFDLKEVNKVTYFQYKRLTNLMSKVEDSIADTDRKARLEKQRCKVCYYIDTDILACQAFTHYHCTACELELIHANSNINALCLDCAKKHKLCIHCGADIELGDRRKL